MEARMASTAPMATMWGPRAGSAGGADSMGECSAMTSW